ncbi:T9SS type A sorting domain-containing protein [Fluviicola taffensis]|uniref:T9SS type A sorting domain-containing protein n=1 Tax=Fluviicola taffensis TaxID=191579 RepID=UPI00313788A6
MKLWTFLVTTLLITTNSISQTAQSNEYVSIKGKKFELNAQPFFPLTINYAVDIVHDNSNNLFIAPHNGYRDPIGYSGTNQAQCFQSVLNDFITIKNLGFNSIRLVGLGFGAAKPWYETNNSTYPAIVSYDINLNNALMTPTNAPYTELFGLIQQVLDAAEQADIKVELLVGSKDFDYDPILPLYTSYLASVATHFADNATLFAYDFFNEPLYFASPSNNKTQVCEIVKSWNNAIKNHCNQLTTIGLGTSSEVFKWDPGMLNLDFLSFHLYTQFTSSLDDVKRQIKWIGETSKIPWVIGETGFSASDDPNLPGMGTLAFQKTFAKTTMEMVRDCGGAGYSWWQYADIGWGAPNSAFGIIDRHGNLKPVSTEFALFDPFTIGTSCAMSTNYYSVPATGSYILDGYILRSGSYPIPNALILGRDANWNIVAEGYSRSSGAFRLFSNTPVTQIDVASPRGFPKHVSSVYNNMQIFLTQYAPSFDLTLNTGGTIVTNAYEHIQADNSITVSSLTIQGNGTSGGLLDMNAANAVRLNSGFIAQKGSRVHIYNKPAIPECNYFVGSNIPPYVQPNNKVEQPYWGWISEENNLSLEESEFKDVTISPNPNNGVFQVSTNGDVTIEKITIVNNLGQTALVLNNPGNISEIDISRFESGVYTVLIVSSSSVFKSKIIKN